MRKTKTPTAVTSAILTLITIFFWAGFEIYRSLTAKPVPPVPANILRPLDPALDINSLNNIESRTFLTDTEIGNVEASSSSAPKETAAPTVAPIPTASASAIPTSSPSATPVPTP